MDRSKEKSSDENAVPNTFNNQPITRPTKKVPPKVPPKPKKPFKLVATAAGPTCDVNANTVPPPVPCARVVEVSVVDKTNSTTAPSRPPESLTLPADCQITLTNENAVTLPERYLMKIKKNRRKSIGSLEDIAEDVEHKENEQNLNESAMPAVSDSLIDRENDLEIAIKWLRQEILLMKQQDRVLMRRLLELRARLHQIRGMCTSHSISSSLLYVGRSCTDLDIHNWDSFMSLDEEALADKRSDPRLGHHDIMTSFQSEPLERSVSTRLPRHSERPVVSIRRKGSMPVVDIDEDLLEEEYFLS